MEVTRDVVRDLMPAVVAGEASADSRTLVEAWLGRDPDLAREADALRSALGKLAAIPRPSPGADAEREALLRVRSRLRSRSVLLAMAIFFTVLPLTVVVQSGRVTFLLVRDQPALAVASLAAAVGCWIGLAIRGRSTGGASR
jgi:anti-sigma factor RsiW